MKQSEQIAYPVGDGAITILECSNCSPKTKIPHIMLMQPASVEVRNEGGVDAIVIHHPACSISLDGRSVAQFYEALKTYFEEGI